MPACTVKYTIYRRGITMTSDNLYRVKKEDFPKLEQLLIKCFEHDPLYVSMIPNEEVRRRLLPELFKCDLDEFYETCEIFADSEEINGILVVSDEAEPYNLLHFYLSEVLAELRTDGYLLKEDPSMKTFRNFIIGRDYLNSSWTDQLHQDNRLHIIYLAVNPMLQHHGIAAKLIGEVVSYADRNGMMISLETHNPKNVDMYKHFGFKMYDTIQKHFGLTQYCMIKQV